MLAPRLRRSLAALLLLTALTACGSGEPAAPAAPAGGAFPVTIEHAFGSTTIERAPERW